MLLAISNDKSLQEFLESPLEEVIPVGYATHFEESENNLHSAFNFDFKKIKIIPSPTEKSDQKLQITKFSDIFRKTNDFDDEASLEIESEDEEDSDEI